MAVDTLGVKGAELTEASEDIIEGLLRACVRTLLVFQQFTSTQLQVGVIIVLPPRIPGVRGAVPRGGGSLSPERVAPAATWMELDVRNHLQPKFLQVLVVQVT